MNNAYNNGRVARFGAQQANAKPKPTLADEFNALKTDPTGAHFDKIMAYNDVDSIVAYMSKHQDIAVTDYMMIRAIADACTTLCEYFLNTKYIPSANLFLDNKIYISYHYHREQLEFQKIIDMMMSVGYNFSRDEFMKCLENGKHINIMKFDKYIDATIWTTYMKYLMKNYDSSKKIEAEIKYLITTKAFVPTNEQIEAYIESGAARANIIKCFHKLDVKMTDKCFLALCKAKNTQLIKCLVTLKYKPTAECLAEYMTSHLIDSTFAAMLNGSNMNIVFEPKK